MSTALDAGAKGRGPRRAKRAANFIQAEVLRDVKTSGLDAIRRAASAVVELLQRVQSSALTGKQG
ncbi:MAG: hypothetical protein IPH72_30825 [Sandaracinaceae bacterium]|nr:hypothetical protein [Sandaracinaceae bacterium]